MTSLSLTPEQRHALYKELVVHLSGIGDVWVAMESEEFATAERLAEEYRDELHFLLGDIGFRDRPSVEGEIPLKTPPEILRRVLRRLEGRAEASSKAHAGERQAVREEESHDRFVRETCVELLSGLERCG